jgi:hypothetical protein
MKLRYLAATAAVVGLGLASPALAANINLNGNGNLNGNLNAALNANLNGNANLNATQNNSTSNSSASASASSNGLDIDTGDITVSVQTLSATNTNSGMSNLVDMTGGNGGTGGTGGAGARILGAGGAGGQGGSGGGAGKYVSGDNNVSGNAFAAYAGILNNAWNTGINANAQAASSIAARGTVTFDN